MERKLHWTSDLVNVFWNGVSGSRLDELSFARLNGAKLLNLISPWLPSNGTVLDFGAGSGFLVQQLLDRGCRVAAFDPSGERESALTSLVGGYANFLGLERGAGKQSYDVVIFSEVIEHLLDKDYQAVLSRMTGFVRPNGVLILTTPNQEDIELKSAFCPTCQHFFHPWQHVRSIAPLAMSEYFEGLGFKKQFLGLVDFSDNAENLEYGRITSRLIDSIERLNNEEKLSLNKKRLDGEFFEKAITPGSQGFVNRLLGGGSDKSVDAVRDELMVRLKAAFDELDEARTRLARLTIGGHSVPNKNSSNAVDLNIGDLSTIVYVGQKTQKTSCEKVSGL